MAVPKRRKSKSKRDSRRATHSLTAKAYQVCENCGAPTLRHQVCSSCGVYKGVEVRETHEVEV